MEQNISCEKFVTYRHPKCPDRNFDRDLDAVENISYQNHSSFPKGTKRNCTVFKTRKRCLYSLAVVLVVMVMVNLALTLWMIKIMDFSGEGIGQLKIVSGGLKLQGKVFVLDSLITNNLFSRIGQPIVVESNSNVILKSRNRGGGLRGYVKIGNDHLECLAENFRILNENGVIFSATSDEVFVGTESLRIRGDGGTNFKGSVQATTIRAESGEDLKLESPTRTLSITAAKEIHFASKGGSINTLALNDISFNSANGAIRLQSSSVIVTHLPTAKAQSSPVGSNTFEVFQVCVCENGKLFLADPASICASENDEQFCR
ncbi:gamma-sarcoglycan-like isoform X2 [Cylas formicarius]|uniref:gamma-sarcoglycan-like isoform X2 n=1 Tax=Cylas formicarius TaxID=197179 RepID=UPI002958D558|nr:gamma-sarcoglycan-like isoform X2 [Cylas formicarius]